MVTKVKAINFFISVAIQLLTASYDPRYLAYTVERADNGHQIPYLRQKCINFCLATDMVPWDDGWAFSQSVSFSRFLPRSIFLIYRFFHKMAGDRARREVANYFLRAKS